jgi:predicted  nucleic acid-binding Zn-ribbon protein
VTRVSNLFRLQTLDSQVDSHDARLAEIDSALARHPELDQARTEEEIARTGQEAARLALRKAEEDARLQQQRIVDTDKMLYGGSVRNPKELQDLQEEAASLRRYQATLEERQLQAMMAFEEAEKATARAQSRREELEHARSVAEDSLRAERTGLQSIVEKINTQREAALTVILPEDLETYLSLRRSKRGVAVVRLEGGSCTGCGVAPSSARIDSARSGQEIIQCGNCGRILYLG